MHLTFVFGTRPEVIKMAPIIHEARRRDIGISVVHTGQHLDLAADLLRFFEIDPDVNLAAMLEKPSLTQLTARVIENLNSELRGGKTDWVLVQGDTTSAFAGAYWAFCNKIKLAHVEAGLRTNDLQSPYPEEANRQLIGRISDIHFAPTEGARSALIKENIDPTKIRTVGNTSIDALLYTLQRIDSDSVAEADLLPREIREFTTGMRTIAVTAHRRENHGAPLERICRSVLAIAESHPENRVVLPVHPNPNVRSQIQSLLKNHPRVLLCEPLGYVSFIQLMKRSRLLITDSGGVQEEAPTLRKPILVIRETTERPEGVEAGFAELVGTDVDRIIESANAALRYGCRTQAANPYGDGTAAQRILDTLEEQ